MTIRVRLNDATSLHRAVHNLTYAESITMAFVLGAGLGSILHFFFMLCLISIRHFGGCSSRTHAERRAARKARRAARREGVVRLEGEDDVKVVQEELPTYEEGESVKLVEKA